MAAKEKSAADLSNRVRELVKQLGDCDGLPLPMQLTGELVAGKQEECRFRFEYFKDSRGRGEPKVTVYA